MREWLPLQGRVRLEAWPRGALGLLVGQGHSLAWARRLARAMETVETANLVVTTGKVLVARMLMDDAGYDTGLTYCAIGTNSTAPAAGDTTLGTEVQRAAVTVKSRTINVVTYSTFFLSGDATYAIEEVGLFGHSTASGAADSGELFNRALLSYDNSGGLVDLTVDIIITVG